MAKYSAGTLEFKIIGTSDASTQSLQRVVDKLNLMNTTLSSVMRNFGGLQSSIKGMTSTDLKWISSLSARLTNLNSKDLTKATSNFLSLTNAITPFIDKVRSAQDALVALSKVMDKTNTMSVVNTALDSTAKKTSATSIKSTSLGKALNFSWALGKIYFIFNY